MNDNKFTKDISIDLFNFINPFPNKKDIENKDLLIKFIESQLNYVYIIGYDRGYNSGYQRCIDKNKINNPKY